VLRDRRFHEPAAAWRDPSDDLDIHRERVDIWRHPIPIGQVDKRQTSTRDPGGLTPEAPVLYKKLGRIAYVTLNRPHVLNALDTHTHEALSAIWDDFERDDAVWLAVLTGSGDRAFSVGQDLKELKIRTEGGVPASSFGSKGAPGWPRLTERHALSKPIIARVDGYAFGGGFELALACDIVVASESASFALPEAKLGLIPGAGGIFRLMRQLPCKTAMGYLITGRRLPAHRAFELGLINEVCPAQELDACVERWSQDILRCAPLSVQAIKDVARSSAHLSVEEAFQTSYPAEELRRNSRDTIEGPRAFLEKRPPKWIGG
jgi:dehydration protein DpgD